MNSKFIPKKIFLELSCFAKETPHQSRGQLKSAFHVGANFLIIQRKNLGLFGKRLGFVWCILHCRLNDVCQHGVVDFNVG
jgi:hypothetical protein